MPGSTKAIKKDLNDKPAPQFFDTVADDYKYLTEVEVYEGVKQAVEGVDFATQTTLAAILAKIIAAPATEATLASVLAKIIAAPATEAKQDDLIAKDFATQTTLAQVLAKIIAAPATEARQATANTALAAIQTAVEGTVDVQVTGSLYEYYGATVAFLQNPRLCKL